MGGHSEGGRLKENTPTAHVLEANSPETSRETSTAAELRVAPIQAEMEELIVSNTPVSDENTQEQEAVPSQSLSSSALEENFAIPANAVSPFEESAPSTSAEPVEKSEDEGTPAENEEQVDESASTVDVEEVAESEGDDDNDVAEEEEEEEPQPTSATSTRASTFIIEIYGICCIDAKL